MAATTYTKGNLVEQALDEIGIASYVFDIEAEEDIAALRKLDRMCASWAARLSTDFIFLQPLTSGGSLPGDDPGVDDADVDAVVLNLALRLAPGYGKTTSGELRSAARDAKNVLFGRYANNTELEMSSRLPMGAGNRRLRRTYFPLATAEE